MQTQSELALQVKLRRTVGAGLLQAIARSEAREPRRGSGERLSALRADARAAAERLGLASRTGSVLTALQADMRETSDADAFAALARELRERALDLVFEPRVESPRPVGFPDATPVGEIAVLDYPSYRLARTPIGRGLFSGTNSAFWTLFRHIQSHEISMTAPVEMTLGEADGRERMDAMAFLYASPQIGRTGAEGAVEVVDVPVARVVSLGLRGGDRERVLPPALGVLREWIAAHPEWEACGAPRVMGWNSPMVPDELRFQEVQIPIRVVATAATAPAR
jgi:hypothetical protein